MDARQAALRRSLVDMEPAQRRLRCPAGFELRGAEDGCPIEGDQHRRPAREAPARLERGADGGEAAGVPHQSRLARVTPSEEAKVRRAIVARTPRVRITAHHAARLPQMRPEEFA